MSISQLINPSSLLRLAAQALPCVIDGLTTEGRPTHGHVGDTLFADNARIIFINGVGSREHHCQEKARQISAIFDGSRVDYIFVPLTFADAQRAIKNRTEPAGSTLVLHTIQQAYHELQENSHPMSCKSPHRYLSGGERIICIVHSGGGATFETIKSQIPQQVLDRIDLVSIGSAHVFDDVGFRNIRNFVAQNDPVPFVCTCLSRNIRALFHEGNNLVPVRGDENPIASHQFSSRTYQPTLEQIRDEYAPELTLAEKKVSGSEPQRK